jgi:nucleoid-associated protein EbfC
MFNPLGGLGDLQKLQQQAQQMQAALQQEEVVVEKNGVKVVVRGDQVISIIEVDGIMENRIADAINEAIKKTQELAAKKLIEISSQQQPQQEQIQ